MLKNIVYKINGIGRYIYWYEVKRQAKKISGGEKWLTQAICEEIYKYKLYGIELDNDAPFIIDAGANVGIATVYFKARWPGAKIKAFEPMPKTFMNLKANVRENMLENVEIYPFALASCDSKLTMYYNTNCAGSSIAGNGDTVQVNAVPLSRFIDKPVDLLKIDVEGSEGAIIDDLADNNKLSMIKNIIIEMHPYVTGFDKIYSQLKKSGFDVKFHQPFYGVAFMIRAHRLLPGGV